MAPRLSVAHPARPRPDASISTARIAHQGFLTMERSSGGQTVPEQNRVVNRTTGRHGPHRVVVSARGAFGLHRVPDTITIISVPSRAGPSCC